MRLVRRRRARARTRRPPDGCPDRRLHRRARPARSSTGHVRGFSSSPASSSRVRSRARSCFALGPSPSCPRSRDVDATLRDSRLLAPLLASAALYVVAQVVADGVHRPLPARGAGALDRQRRRPCSRCARSPRRRCGSAWAAGPTSRGSRMRPLRSVGLAMTVSIALVAATASCGRGRAACRIVLATAVSMAWNGLSFTLAAELGGRRSGAAIGFQQTVLSASGVGAPVAFAALVSWTSWQAAFAVAAVFPLAGSGSCGSSRPARSGSRSASAVGSARADPRPTRPARRASATGSATRRRRMRRTSSRPAGSGRRGSRSRSTPPAT